MGNCLKPSATESTSPVVQSQTIQQQEDNFVTQTIENTHNTQVVRSISILDNKRDSLPQETSYDQIDNIIDGYTFAHIISYASNKIQTLFILSLVNKELYQYSNLDYIWKEISIEKGYGAHTPANVTFKEACYRVFEAERKPPVFRLKPIPMPHPPCGLRPPPRMVTVEYQKYMFNYIPNSILNWKDHPGNMDSREPDKLIMEFSDYPLLSDMMNFLYGFENTLSKCLSDAFLKNSMAVKAAIRRYVMFMKLKAKYHNAVLIPTHDIMMIWISHMIRPDHYEIDCHNLFQMKDEPHVQLKYSTKIEKQMKKELLTSTEQVWKEEYGEDYFILCSTDLNQSYNVPPPPPPPPPFPVYFGVNDTDEKIETETYVFPSNGTTFPDAFILDHTVEKGMVSFEEWLKKANATDYQNPLSVSVEAIAEDRKWFQYYKEFIQSNRKAFDADFNTESALCALFVDKSLKSYEKVFNITYVLNTINKNYLVFIPKCKISKGFFKVPSNICRRSSMACTYDATKVLCC
jgi:hypothetical protein